MCERSVHWKPQSIAERNYRRYDTYLVYRSKDSMPWIGQLSPNWSTDSVQSLWEFQHRLLKRLCFLWISFHLFKKLVAHIYVGLFLDSFQFHWSICVCLSSNITIFWLLHLNNKFWNWDVLILQLSFSILFWLFTALCNSTMHLRIGFSISAEKAAGIPIGIVLNL